MGAVVAMLDQARNLPVLRDPPVEAVRRALDEFGSAFLNQPWMNPNTAAEEVRALLDFYNGKTTRGQYLF